MQAAVEPVFFRLESAACGCNNAADDCAIAVAIKEVATFSREIFAGEITLTEKADNEIAGDHHIAVSVADSGELDAIVARNDQWHARLCSLPPEVRCFFRLSIDAR